MPGAVGAGAVIKAFIVKLIITAAINVAVAKVAKALQKRPVRVLQKVDVAYQGGLQPRRRLYGRFRAAGLDVMPAVVSGFNGERLHKCMALSDGEIAGIDGFYVNQDYVNFSTDVTAGKVTSGPYAGFMGVEYRLGTASQTVPDAMLQSPPWSTAHRGDGVAYLYNYFTASNNVYKLGAPSIVVVGRGNLNYDPRLDTSPGAHPTSGTYKAFGDNPALCLADYLIWSAGGCEDPANMVWADVVAAANACDGTVTIPNGVGGTTTQTRYTCSVEVYSPQSQAERDETIKMLARAMMGACWFADGKWHMRAGVYSSPADSIVDEDFLGDSLNIATAQSRAQSGIFNTVRGSFVDESENTQPKAFPEVSSSSFITSDGEQIYTDVEFHTCRTAYEAQRNAILLLRQSRRRIIISGTLRFKFSGLQLYDVVNVTLTKIGWTSQPARIIRIRHFQNFTVQVELQEIASGDFTDPTTAEYTTPGAVAPIVSTNYVPDPPTNLRTTSLANALLLQWDPPANAPIGAVYRVLEYSSSTPYTSATQVAPDTAQTSLVIPRSNTTTTYFWVETVDPSTKAVSSPSPPTNGVPGNAASSSSALSAVVTPGSASSDTSSGSQTTGACAVLATGGTAPYTYAWSWDSGGTGISITSASSSSTIFSATGLNEGDTRSGTAKCHITDNVGATVDVYVTVNIHRQFAITLLNRSPSVTTGNMSAAVISVAVTPDGLVQISDGTSTYRWAAVGVSGSSYDVQFDLLSGTLQSGTTGTPLQLNTGRAVVGVRTPGQGAGSSHQQVQITIFAHGSSTPLATCTISMTEAIS